MSQPPAARHRTPSDAGRAPSAHGPPTAASSATQPVARHDDPATTRARAGWVLLALCVLLGVVLLSRYGAAVLPLIREAR